MYSISSKRKKLGKMKSSTRRNIPSTTSWDVELLLHAPYPTLTSTGTSFRHWRVPTTIYVILCCNLEPLMRITGITRSLCNAFLSAERTVFMFDNRSWRESNFTIDDDFRDDANAQPVGASSPILTLRTAKWPVLQRFMHLPPIRILKLNCSNEFSYEKHVDTDLEF